jgi:hypothetical protein
MLRPVGVLMLAVLLCAPADAGAEWQFKPLVGVTFAPFTTYNDPEHAAGSASPADPEVDSGSSHLAFGGALVLIGEVFGAEMDLGHAPGFFEAIEAGGEQEKLVLGSSVRTLTGNLVVALPRRVSEYTLRPYVVAGLGVMYVKVKNALTISQFDVADRVPAIDVGGGATGFFTDRLGVGWDLRYFRSVGSAPGVTLFEDGQLSFWRANMSVVVRY